MTISTRRTALVVRALRELHFYSSSSLSDEDVQRIKSNLPLLYGVDHLVTTLTDEIIGAQATERRRSLVVTTFVLAYIVVCGVFPHMPGSEFVTSNSEILNTISLSLFSIIQKTTWYFEILIHIVASFIFFVIFNIATESVSSYAACDQLKDYALQLFKDGEMNKGRRSSSTEQVVPHSSVSAPKVMLQAPEKVTIKWLLEHVPVEIWLSFISIVLAAFFSGAKLSQNPYLKQLLGL